MLCTWADFVDVKMIEEKENPFFERKELKIELKHPGESTPKKQDVIKELASRFKVDEKSVEIDYIFTKKGVAESVAKVKIMKKPREKGEKAEAQTS